MENIGVIDWRREMVLYFSRLSIMENIGVIDWRREMVLYFSRLIVPVEMMHNRLQKKYDAVEKRNLHMAKRNLHMAIILGGPPVNGKTAMLGKSMRGMIQLIRRTMVPFVE